jgi:hypothetical protein
VALDGQNVILASKCQQVNWVCILVGSSTGFSKNPKSGKMDENEGKHHKNETL